MKLGCAQFFFYFLLSTVCTVCMIGPRKPMHFFISDSTAL